MAITSLVAWATCAAAVLPSMVTIFLLTMFVSCMNIECMARRAPWAHPCDGPRLILMAPLRDTLGIHHGDGRHLDDFIHTVATLQDVHRLAHPHQDRADRLGPPQVMQKLVADIARVEIGKDEDVGPSLQLREGKPFQQFRDNR